MSPEQCEGAGRVDAKSDVYSLGVLLFELLAGRPPFIADGGGKVLGMHMFVPPPLLREFAPQIPASICEMVQRLLAKPKEQRPTMRQVATALETLCQKHPLAKRMGGTAALEIDGAQPASDTVLMLERRHSTLGLSASRTIQHRPRLRRFGILLSTTLLSALVVLMLVMHFGSRQRHVITPAPERKGPAPEPPPVPTALPHLTSPEMGAAASHLSAESSRRVPAVKPRVARTPVRSAPLPELPRSPQSTKRPPTYAKPIED